MPDPSTPQDAVTEPRHPEIVNELTRSLTAIWSKHSGGKPDSATTEVKSNSVRFELAGAVGGIGAVADDAEPEVDPDAVPRSPNTYGYKNEAIAAVRRITGRKVVGFVPKRNKKTDVASDTYLLERIHVGR